jgi:hypothetical protein
MAGVVGGTNRDELTVTVNGKEKCKLLSSEKDFRLQLSFVGISQHMLASCCIEGCLCSLI